MTRLLDINWHPSDRQLRQFAGSCIVALPLVAWIWGASVNAIGILALGAFALAAVSMFLPIAIKPLYLALSLVALPIGIVVGELALVAIYFGVFAPMGLLFRFLQRDALRLRRDPSAASYWQPKQLPRGPASYYRQS